MAYRLFLSAFFVFLSGVSPLAFGEVREDLEIYLVIGQSNMAGRAPIEAEDEAELERCFLFNTEGEWELATNPLNRYSTVRKAIRMQRLGPAYTFGRSMAERDSEANVGLVVNARGGTSIMMWERGDELYNEALARFQEARKSGTLRGIIWHQGEGNSRDPEYIEKLARLVAALRSDLDLPELPFIAGQVEGDREVNQLIAQTDRAIVHASAVSSALLTTYDGTHFDAPSQRELGRRYAMEMIRLQERGEREGREIALFDGETFAGWEGPVETYFRIEEGAIVGGKLGEALEHNQFLTTKRHFRNFDLTLMFKLIGSEEVNSGVQFRTQRAPGLGEVIGYQADLGNPGWWGSLYDESRRNLVLAQSEAEVIDRVLKRGEWNEYRIRAAGNRIELWINGELTADYLEAEPLVPNGVIGLQIHSGPGGEAWFKDIAVTELPEAAEQCGPNIRSGQNRVAQ